MELTKEQVTKNAKKYFSTAEKYNFMNDDLMEFLGEEFIAAPASTRTDLHNAYEGGLIDHLLTVAKYAVGLNNLLPETDQVSMESLLKVSLLHQIGKANLYVENDSQWHRERGMMYEFNDTLVSMSVGERSIYYATNYGIKLSEEEYQAILNYDKGGDDKQAKWHTSTLGIVLRQANDLAILEEKNKNS